LEEARGLEADLRNTRDSKVSAQLREEQARADLAGTADTTPELSPCTVAEAERLAQELRAAADAVDALHRQQTDAPPAPRDVDIDNHARAADALRVWLAAERGHRGWVVWALAAVALGALVAGGAAAQVQAWLGVAGAAVVLIASGAVAFALRDRRREDAAARFAETQLQPPAAWTVPSVTARRDAIEEQLGELRRDQARARAAEDLAPQIERAEARLARVRDAVTRLAGRLGLDPEVVTSAGGYFVQRIRAYQEAVTARRQAELDEGSTQSELNTRLAAVTDLLAAWSPPVESTVDALSTATAKLARRASAAKQATQQLAEAVRTIDRVERDLERNHAQIVELYDGARIPFGDEATLRERLARLDEWRVATRALHDAQRDEAQARSAVVDVALTARVEAKDAEGLEADRDAARATADEFEALRSEVTRIETEVNRAGRDAELARAGADVRRAEDALRRRRDEVLLAAAGRFLLFQVEAEHRATQQPALLTDTRARFQRFTHHAWDVEISAEGELVPIDVARGARCTITELSSGTRMQLLLAARLSWIRSIESERKPLPIFLDEALTTADPARFGQMAQSLTQLAQDEGRQVFYLCARPEEVEMWAQVTGVQPRAIDLGRVRGRTSVVHGSSLRLVERTPIPEPNGVDAASYAERLGVPAVEPRRPVEGLHVFHLLRDDLTLLWTLLENWRVETLGPLESLLNGAAGKLAVSDDGARRRLAARCGAARVWFEKFAQGRGRPVDRHALEASDAVSPTFIDRVTALADEVSGDGRALVAGLRAGRVPRFQQQSIDKLETFLIEEGYIETSAVLSTPDRERETIQAVAARGDLNVEDIGTLVRWLEAGASSLEPPPPTALREAS
jgi:hypothetical protein